MKNIEKIQKRDFLTHLPVVFRGHLLIMLARIHNELQSGIGLNFMQKKR